MFFVYVNALVMAGSSVYYALCYALGTMLGGWVLCLRVRFRVCMWGYD